MQNVITYKIEDEVFLILYSLPDAITFNKKHPNMMLEIGFDLMENIAAIEKPVFHLKFYNIKPNHNIKQTILR